MVALMRDLPLARKSGLAVLGILFVGLAWYSSTRLIDFQVYHRVATQILRGDYALYPQAVYDGTSHGESHEFLDAPAIAFLFVPFGLLSLQAAAFVFACLKIWPMCTRAGSSPGERAPSRGMTGCSDRLAVRGGWLSRRGISQWERARIHHAAAGGGVRTGRARESRCSGRRARRRHCDEAHARSSPRLFRAETTVRDVRSHARCAGVAVDASRRASSVSR